MLFSFVDGIVLSIFEDIYFLVIGIINYIVGDSINFSI